MPFTRPWTPAETKTLLEGVAAGLRMDVIAAKLPGRTVGACYARHLALTEMGKAPARPRREPDPPPQLVGRAPVPGSAMDRLLRHLQRCAARGEPIGSTFELAEEIGCGSASGVSQLLQHAQKRGLIVVQHAAGRRGIEAVAAADGSWRVVGSAAAPVAATRQRRCLCCRKPFDAQHRLNFVCEGCKTSDTWSSGVAA